MTELPSSVARTSAYPVVYDLKQLVAGNDFFARVDVAGRALLEEDGDGAVFSGVQPAGFAGCGANRGEAWADFLAEHRAALFDMAEEAADFEHFQRAVEDFFAGPNGALESLWTAAVEAQKRNASNASWTRTLQSHQARRVEVTKLKIGRPDANHPDPQPSVLAPMAA